MTFLTLAQIKTRIQEPLDLEEETGVGQFIEDAELTNLINKAIDVAEATIIDLYEDYFLTKAYLALVSGTSEYDLPSDCYAHKIRTIAYNDGSTKYEIRRYRGKLQDIDNVETSEDYRYIIDNKAAGAKLVLLPASRETSSTNVKVWYLRNAKVLSGVSDTCDLPEAVNFVIAQTQGYCLAKENGGVIPAGKQAEIDEEKARMIATLSDRFPDEDTKIIPEVEHYKEHN